MTLKLEPVTDSLNSASFGTSSLENSIKSQAIDPMLLVEKPASKEEQLTLEANTEKLNSGDSNHAVQPLRTANAKVSRGFHLDPIFFIVMTIVTVGIAAGLSAIYWRSDRLLQQNLRDLIVETAALEARISFNESSSNAVAEVAATPVAAVVEKNDVPALHAEPEVFSDEFGTKNQSTTVSLKNKDAVVLVDEIDALKAQIESQSEQISVLSLENHELRLAAFVESSSGGGISEKSIDQKPADDLAPIVTFDSVTLASIADSQRPTNIQDTAVPLVNDVSHTNVRDNTVSRDLDAMLLNGSQAYDSGDYAAAQQWYDKAILVSPDSRDANFGVAAIATILGSEILAVNRYRHLLTKNLNDQAAFAALLLLSNAENNIEQEMRELLEQQPKKYAALHGVLGDFYSQQGQWSEASGAYARALASPNVANNAADNLFNMAVSLDNLGQIDTASNYYRKALSTSGVHSFDRDSVINRLKFLR